MKPKKYLTTLLLLFACSALDQAIEWKEWKNMSKEEKEAMAIDSLPAYKRKIQVSCRQNQALLKKMKIKKIDIGRVRKAIDDCISEQDNTFDLNLVEREEDGRNRLPEITEKILNKDGKSLISSTEDIYKVLRGEEARNIYVKVYEVLLALAVEQGFRAKIIEAYTRMKLVENKWLESDKPENESDEMWKLEIGAHKRDIEKECRELNIYEKIKKDEEEKRTVEKYGIRGMDFKTMKNLVDACFTSHLAFDLRRIDEANKNIIMPLATILLEKRLKKIKLEHVPLDTSLPLWKLRYTDVYEMLAVLAAQKGPSNSEQFKDIYIKLKDMELNMNEYSPDELSVYKTEKEKKLDKKAEDSLEEYKAKELTGIDEKADFEEMVQAINTCVVYYDDSGFIIGFNLQKLDDLFEPQLKNIIASIIGIPPNRYPILTRYHGYPSLAKAAAHKALAELYEVLAILAAKQVAAAEDNFKQVYGEGTGKALAEYKKKKNVLTIYGIETQEDIVAIGEQRPVKESHVNKMCKNAKEKQNSKYHRCPTDVEEKERHTSFSEAATVKRSKMIHGLSTILAAHQVIEAEEKFKYAFKKLHLYL